MGQDGSARGGDGRRVSVAITALVLGSIALGSSPILVRLSELEPVATGFYRVALAAPALGLILALGSRRQAAAHARSLRRSDLAWLGLAGLFFAADLAFLHRSLHHTNVANATLFLNVAPFFLVFGRRVLFGERLTPVFLASLLIAVGGVGILVGGTADLSADRLHGDGLALLAGAFYGTYLLIVSGLNGLPTALVMAVSTATSALVLLGVVTVLGESLMPLTPSGWLTLAALALVTHAGGQGLVAYALKVLPASSSSTALLLQPVAAAGAAWIIFGERLGTVQVTGGLIVLMAIFACHRAASRRPARVVVQTWRGLDAAPALDGSGRQS